MEQVQQVEKSSLRKQLLRIRREIPEEVKQEKSTCICKQILELDIYQKAELLYAFMPYNGEPDIRPVLEHAWKNGKTVLVPKVYGDIMQFIAIRGYEELASGAYGILEPTSDQVYQKSTEQSECMLVPGTAFTLAGDRMGYGGGYYDKYLSGHRISTVGLCYREQLREALPTEPSDHRVNNIIYA